MALFFFLQSPPEGTPSPTAWLAIRFPGEYFVHRSAPVPATPDGYQHGVRLQYRRKLSPALLNELISSPVQITLYKVRQRCGSGGFLRGPAA